MNFTIEFEYITAPLENFAYRCLTTFDLSIKGKIAYSLPDLKERWGLDGYGLSSW